jgi:hypothetical protein
VLGKALFWDMQVGSDGVQACATCHFRAGADPRTKNQISPGFLRVTFQPGGGMVPDPDFDFAAGGVAQGPNYRLTPEDFPLRRLTVPADRESAIEADTNNVVASQACTMRSTGRTASPPRTPRAFASVRASALPTCAGLSRATPRR